MHISPLLTQQKCFQSQSYGAHRWQLKGLALSLAVGMLMLGAPATTLARELGDPEHNSENQYNNHYNKPENYNAYHRYYRPYYPWGSRWYLGSNLGYGWGSNGYWNSPYSSIGLSVPMREKEEPVAVSAPERVTTSMQYAPNEGRMVSSMPASANGQTSALAPKAHRARSVPSLPSNARVVQQDGRTLYEWQGILYAYDWNNKTYQEQFVK